MALFFLVLLMGCSKEEVLIHTTTSDVSYLSFEDYETLEAFHKKMQAGDLKGSDLNPNFVSASDAFEEKIKALEAIEANGDEEAYWEFVDLNDGKIWYFDDQDRMQPIYVFEDLSSLVNEEGLLRVGDHIIKIYKNKRYLFPLEMEEEASNLKEINSNKYIGYLDVNSNETTVNLRANCTSKYSNKAYNPELTREVEFIVERNSLSDAYNGYHRPKIILKTVTRKKKGKLFGGYKWVHYSNDHYQKATRIKTSTFTLLFNGNAVNTNIDISFSKRLVNRNNSTAQQTFYPEEYGHISLNSSNPNLYLPDLNEVFASGTSQGVITVVPEEIWANISQRCY